MTPEQVTAAAPAEQPPETPKAARDGAVAFAIISAEVFAHSLAAVIVGAAPRPAVAGGLRRQRPGDGGPQPADGLMTNDGLSRGEADPVALVRGGRRTDGPAATVSRTSI